MVAYAKREVCLHILKLSESIYVDLSDRHVGSMEVVGVLTELLPLLVGKLYTRILRRGATASAKV